MNAIYFLLVVSLFSVCIAFNMFFPGWYLNQIKKSRSVIQEAGYNFEIFATNTRNVFLFVGGLVFTVTMAVFVENRFDLLNIFLNSLKYERPFEMIVSLSYFIIPVVTMILVSIASAKSGINMANKK